MFYFNKKAGNTTSKDYVEQLEQIFDNAPLKETSNANDWPPQSKVMHHYSLGKHLSVINF